MTLERQFDALLGAHDPAIQALARDARALVVAVQPDAHQEVYPGWGGYLMFRRGAGTGVSVCHLSAHQKHVSIGFSQGAALPDPAGLLQGGGKHSRHVKLKTSADVKNPALRALVAAAWAQQPAAAVLDDALDRVRKICAAFPETSETVSHGHPTFWAGKKTFAVFGLYSPSVAFKADFEMHAALEEDPRFVPTPYLAQSGWLSLKIDTDTDWDVVADVLDHSYRQVATRKLLAALSARRGES